MPLDLSKLAKEIREQKAKYHAKVISEDAIYSNWLHTIEVEDLLPVWVWLDIPEFNLSALALSLLFDITPSEFEPLPLDFDVELPSPEEFLQGILLEINSIDLSEIFEWLQSLEQYIEEVFEEYFSDQIIPSRMEKGYYGEVKYDYAYYDPPLVYEFLRSTFLKLFKERKTFPSLKQDYENLKDTLNMNPHIVQHLFNRISMITSAQKTTFILDYGVLDQSFLGEEVEEGVKQGKVGFIDYNLESKEVGAYTLDHIQYGFYLDITPLNNGFLIEKKAEAKTMYKQVEVTTYTGYSLKGKPPFLDLILHKITRIKNTFRHTSIAFANYTKPEEKVDYRVSERTDQFASLQMIRYLVENAVDDLIRQEETNPVKIRAYKSATLQLIGYKTKRHKWGFSGFTLADMESFKDWWLKHWEQQGLNRNLLEEIYRRIEPCLNHLQIQRTLLGLRVKTRRYQLAHSL